LRIHHYGIEVKDMEASKKFYQKILGLNHEKVVKFKGEELVFLSSKSLCLELIPREQESSHEQSTHLCLEVTDIYQIIKGFSENGVEVLEGPYTLSNGWKTVFFEGLNHEILEFLEIGERYGSAL
jgi:lactoylglutathione lyase